ncbi:MAG TPA: class I SAM-dependent methyltransferase [Acidimicrobiales bacterium]|nr:class I SAM-dependent methyltransferase [Acidimicrobiales bacterium]
MTSPHVDYETSAGDYAERRSLTEGRLSVWAGEVGPYVEHVDIAVDLGAGTGGFSSALHDWGASRVIAVEPSSAMEAEATRTDGVDHVRARAESIPLRSHSSQLVWISTAFHHFEEPTAAARECHRVLVGAGYVVIRGFVPGHSELEWLHLFPGSLKAVARFPSFEEINRLFSLQGFRLVRDGLVMEGTQTYEARAEYSARMRHADSILTAMSEAEVAAGIAALRSRGQEIEHFALSCLIYQRD